MSLKIVRSSNNAVLDNIFYQKTIANGCNYIYWHNPFFVGTKLYIINCCLLYTSPSPRDA